MHPKRRKYLQRKEFKTVVLERLKAVIDELDTLRLRNCFEDWVRIHYLEKKIEELSIISTNIRVLGKYPARRYSELPV